MIAAVLPHEAMVGWLGSQPGLVTLVDSPTCQDSDPKLSTLRDIDALQPSYVSELWLSLEEIRSEIVGWQPAWCRYSSEGAFFWIRSQEALVWILRAVTWFRSRRVGTAIFFTSCPHHLHTLALDLAARAAGIPRVYLKYVPLSGRLLPTQTTESPSEAQPLALRISDFSHNSLVEVWRTGAATSTPSNGAQAWSGSAALRRMVTLRRPTVNEPDNWFTPDISWPALLKQAKAKRRFHRYLVEREAAETSLPRGATVLFASFQPESTSFPEAGSIESHTAMALELQRVILAPRHFYYVEHPAMQLSWMRRDRSGIARSIQYYRDLTDLGFTLLSQDGLPIGWRYSASVLAASITGSISIERSLRGASTLLANWPWCGQLTGMHRISELGDGAIDPNGSPLDAQPADVIGNLAAAKLRKILDGTTLGNAPGIGMGSIRSSDAVWTEFRRGFSRLCSQLEGRRSQV